MRNRIIAVLAAALAALPAAAGAQARQDAALQQAAAPAPALAADPRVAVPADAGEAAPAAAPEQAPAALVRTRESRAASTRHRVALTLGGAIVGGWAGYLGSQVARSDWDKQNNGDFTSYRMGFTVGGALLGGLTGLLVSGGDNGGVRRVRPMMAARDGGSSRDVINENEIRQSTARHALELVQALRPEWLQRRGTQNQRESGRADQTGERSLRIIDPEGGIKVYLDNALIGEITALREIPLTSVYQARFMDAASATYRFGSGHTHGAIVLTSNPRAQ